jgi:hypothetical protein
MQQHLQLVKCLLEALRGLLQSLAVVKVVVRGEARDEVVQKLMRMSSQPQNRPIQTQKLLLTLRVSKQLVPHVRSLSNLLNVLGSIGIAANVRRV